MIYSTASEESLLFNDLLNYRMWFLCAGKRRLGFVLSVHLVMKLLLELLHEF